MSEYTFDIRDLSMPELIKLQEALDEIMAKRNEELDKEIYNKIKSLEGKYYMNSKEVFKIIKVDEDYTVLIISCPKKPTMGGLSLIHTLQTVYWSVDSFNAHLMEEAFPITEDIFKNIVNYFVDQLLSGDCFKAAKDSD